MPEALLTTLSQISLGIAGFSGIAVVLIARGNPEWAAKQLSHIKSMIETSMTVMMFSLLPLTLDFITSDPLTGLAYLTVIFGLWHMLIFTIGAKRSEFFGNDVAFVAIVVISVSVMLAKLVAGVAGLFGTSEYLLDAYVLGLFWLLFVSVINFCLLIYSSFEIDD